LAAGANRRVSWYATTPGATLGNGPLSAAREQLDYRRLFEQSPDILLVLLPDAPRFTMVGATRARLAVTHTTYEQILGKALFDVFPDAPTDPAATGTRNLQASLDRVLATRAPDTMAVQRYDIQGADGQFATRYWSPKNIPVLDANGEIIYILHRVEDVTELVRASESTEALLAPARAPEREVVARSRELGAANEALREATEKLKELDRAKTEFFSNVSHEFRTPLTLMLGPLEDALTDNAEPLGPAQKSRVTLAHDNALRLLKLVNALLDFSRLQAGRAQARFVPLDIALFTAELAGMFESAVARTAVRLIVDCPPLSEPVWVDRDMWEKIVLNLVSNAFKFTHEGQIAVRLRDEPASVTLEVGDTGIGIPEVELPRIFERFHRVTGVAGRAYEGTGIGLALVRELVELHGGSVGVTSAVGTGTTFRVQLRKGFAHLPAEAVAQQAEAAHVSREAAAHVADAARWLRLTEVAGTVRQLADAERPATRPRVLIIDDNADLREYMGSLLAPAYEVSTANDGLKGLAAAQTELPDIIVSDVMMPGLNGIELVRTLRADPRTASLPVILVSARAGEEAAVEGLDAGSDDYLIKPFSAAELLARVRTHVQLALKRREWIRQLESANHELDAFTYSVAHDLRAPLRGINGMAEILRESKLGQLDPDGQKYLHFIHESGKRAAQLIEDLLKLSRITRGELTRQSLDLSELVREVAQQLGNANPNRRVDLVVADGVRAAADPRLLRVALENLLSNAWKFTSKRATARIEFGVEEQQGAPVYFIRDNGAGFDMAYADRLFGVFQRLHHLADFEGTGVGLATVQRILKRHGGRIWADSAINKGATFFFTLGSPSTGVAVERM
jgi:signal transduction histidine kinase